MSHFVQLQGFSCQKSDGNLPHHADHTYYTIVSPEGWLKKSLKLSDKTEWTRFLLSFFLLLSNGVIHHFSHKVLLGKPNVTIFSQNQGLQNCEAKAMVLCNKVHNLMSKMIWPVFFRSSHPFLMLENIHCPSLGVKNNSQPPWFDRWSVSLDNWLKSARL